MKAWRQAAELRSKQQSVFGVCSRNFTDFLAHTIGSNKIHCNHLTGSNGHTGGKQKNYEPEQYFHMFGLLYFQIEYTDWPYEQGRNRTALLYVSFYADRCIINIFPDWRRNVQKTFIFDLRNTTCIDCSFSGYDAAKR